LFLISLYRVASRLVFKDGGIFRVTSNGKSVAFLGDLTHDEILLLEKPLEEFYRDTDPKPAAGVRMLNMAAANDIAVMSYQFVLRVRTCRQDRGWLPLHRESRW
jgi:hypothetical protein